MSFERNVIDLLGCIPEFVREHISEFREKREEEIPPYLIGHPFKEEERRATISLGLSPFGVPYLGIYKILD